MATPLPRCFVTASSRAWSRVRHEAFLTALRAFDAWMGATEKKREAVSILASMGAALLTILAFAWLFIAVLRALWTGVYPWVKHLPFIATDVAFATVLTASGVLLCLSWKLMLRSMEAGFRWLHPDNHQAWMDSATDSFLLRRIRRFEKPLLTCSPLERRLAEWLWQEERVVRAKAALLDAHLMPVPDAEEAPKRARL